MVRIRIALLSSCLVVGCTSVPLAETPPDDSRALLESAIKRVDQMPAGTKSADHKLPAAVMGGASVSVAYAGEGKTLLKQIAAARGLSFNVRGPQPHLPLFVIVDVKEVSLEEFLTDVGSQFGQRATLALTNSAIEVRYRAQ